MPAELSFALRVNIDNLRPAEYQNMVYDDYWTIRQTRAILDEARELWPEGWDTKGGSKGKR